MKVLIVHRLIASYGGAHKYLCNLVDVLHSLKCQVHLAINPNEAIGGLQRKLEASGVVINVIDFDQIPEAQAGEVFDELLLHVQPDLVDFESAAKSLRSFALRSHSFRESSAIKIFTMHLPIVTDQSLLRGWKARIPFSHAWRGLRERRAFLDLFDCGLSVSDFHAENIKRLLALPRDFFSVIPNGVDTDVFKPSSGRQPNNPLKVVACGGLTPQKRFDILIASTFEARQRGVEFDVEIAGEGAERDKLEAQISKLGLGESVRLLGHVSDTASFLRAGDIYVLSSDSEGLPYATIEAMATGIASVVTRVGEVPFLVRQGREGIVVDNADASMLAKAIESLLVDEALRRELGKSARERILKYHEHKKINQLIESFYAGKLIAQA